MKISFIGYKENQVNLFKDLAKKLSKRISGLELEERFVPFPIDLPAVANECANSSDFVVVFAFVEEEEMADLIKRKLIDVEIATKTRILKYVESDGLSGIDENDYFDKKEALVDELCNLIVSILFNEFEFEPKDKDFSV